MSPRPRPVVRDSLGVGLAVGTYGFAFGAASVAAGLNVAGMSLDMLFWQTRFDRTPVWHLVSLTVSLAILVWLPLKRTFTSTCGSIFMPLHRSCRLM